MILAYILGGLIWTALGLLAAQVCGFNGKRPEEEQ